MSIPSVPEDGDGEAAINILAECVNNMMRAAGLDHAKTLSHHAATRDHEDVPSRTIKEGVLEGNDHYHGSTPLTWHPSETIAL